MLLRSPTRSDNSTSSSPTSSPPTTPTKRVALGGVGGVANIFLKIRSPQQKDKAHHIKSSSGAPRSHPGITPVDGVSRPLEVTERFICTEAVTVPHLLRATRNTLLEGAEALGANALVNEQWSCTICSPKHRSNGVFRVETRYSAAAVRSRRPDPHTPVALDQVRNVPGLMHIISRNDN